MDKELPIDVEGFINDFRKKLNVDYAALPETNKDYNDIYADMQIALKALEDLSNQCENLMTISEEGLDKVSKAELKVLRNDYESKVQREIDFRGNEREAGGYHQMDRFRSLERQHVYQDVVKDLDSLINK